MVTQEDWLNVPYPVSKRKARYSKPEIRHIERIYDPMDADSTIDDEIEWEYEPSE